MKTIYLYIHKTILSDFKRPSASNCLVWKSLSPDNREIKNIITNTDEKCVVTSGTWRKGMETASCLCKWFCVKRKHTGLDFNSCNSLVWKCLGKAWQKLPHAYYCLFTSLEKLQIFCTKWQNTEYFKITCKNWIGENH